MGVSLPAPLLLLRRLRVRARLSVRRAGRVQWVCVVFISAVNASVQKGQHFATGSLDPLVKCLVASFGSTHPRSRVT